MKENLIKVWGNRGVYKTNLLYPKNWVDNFTDFFKQRKYKRERALYGVSTKDMWSFDSYFYEMLHNALIIYKRDTIGYPGMLTPEEWDNVLDHMIFLCDELRKYDSDINTEPGRLWEEYYNDGMKDDELKEKWLEAEEEFATYQTDCRYELMDLLKEWLPHIWW